MFDGYPQLNKKNCIDCGKPFNQLIESRVARNLGQYRNRCRKCEDKYQQAARDRVPAYMKSQSNRCKQCNGTGKFKGYTCCECNGTGKI